jgi:hypothetical protein
VLIGAALAAGLAALLIALLSGGGGGTRKGEVAAGSSAAVTASGKHASHARGTHPGRGVGAPASNPAAVNVVVLNGTGATGLAHRISGELHQSGYARAVALNGRPPGANQVTVVEYASGHRGEAEGVARAIGVSQAQPMESTVASLSGSATIVVIVGLDKAAAAP